MDAGETVVMEKIETFGIVCMCIFAIFLIILLVLISSGYLEEQETELYSAYADSSIFKDGKVSIDYVRTSCIGSKDYTIWKCKADLVFNDRAVGFVNFQEKKQEGE